MTISSCMRTEQLTGLWCPLTGRRGQRLRYKDSTVSIAERLKYKSTYVNEYGVENDSVDSYDHFSSIF